MSGQMVGYVRVSTSAQTLDAQTDALTALGCSVIFAEKVSGVRADRPEYGRMLAYVREGDVVVVTSLDRLGRSLTDVVLTVEALRQRGVYVRALRESIDTATSVGRMLAGIFASLAAYERELIMERTAVARQAARDRGKLPGAPRKLTPDQVRQAAALRAAGESVPDLCRTFRVSRATLYRALRRGAVAGVADPGAAA